MIGEFPSNHDTKPNGVQAEEYPESVCVIILGDPERAYTDHTDEYC